MRNNPNKHRLPPFDRIPEAVWLKALRLVTPKPALWDLNYAAFKAGQALL